MCAREKMAKEKMKISLRLAAFLALCVPLGSCEINSCTKDLFTIQCRGRCATAVSTKVCALDSEAECTWHNPNSFPIHYTCTVRNQFACDLDLSITICLSSDLLL